MNWEVIDAWRNASRQTHMFRFKNINDGSGEIFYQTEDSPEKAEQNFQENIEAIVNKAVYLINEGLANEEGHYIIKSELMNNANIT